MNHPDAGIYALIVFAALILCVAGRLLMRFWFRMKREHLRRLAQGLDETTNEKENL